MQKEITKKISYVSLADAFRVLNIEARWIAKQNTPTDPEELRNFINQKTGNDLETIQLDIMVDYVIAKKSQLEEEERVRRKLCSLEQNIN